MGEVTGSQVAVAILTDAQIEEARKLRLDRDDSYRRFTSARDALELMFQKIAGMENDFKLDTDQKCLIVTARPGKQLAWPKEKDKNEKS